MNRWFALLALSSVVALPGRAQESGLLLGLRVSDSDSLGPYQTFWIAPANGRSRVLLRGPDLIVPGRTGFWRTCLVRTFTDEDKQHYESDSVVTEPATPSRAHCEATHAKLAEESGEGYSCTSSDETLILFVGPTAISTQNSWEGNCGAHPSSAETVYLTSLTGRDSIAYLGITDSVRTRSLLAATTEAARDQFADIGNVDSVSEDPDGIPDRPTISTEAQWGVQRGQGYWHAVGEASCSPIIACMQVSTFAVPDFRAPRELVGHDQLFPPFDSIRKVVPSAKDAVSSPRRDLVVVVTNGDGLLVFVPRNGKLGVPVAKFDVSGDIVMAQWATGRFVPIWTSKLGELLPGRLACDATACR